MKEFINRWYFSLFFFAMYLITFHLWEIFNTKQDHLLIGISSFVVCSLFFFYAYKKQYFLSRVDIRAHLLVLFDILLETLIYKLQELLEAIKFISPQDNFKLRSGYDFYVCAFVFAIVIGLFRYRLLKKSQLPS